MLSTSQKILIARSLCALVVSFRRLFGLPANVTAKRHGVNWALDLQEGIDLAIYVLGGFEVRTIRRYQALVQHGDVVLDIGANIGAHTLPLAKLVGHNGKVVALEPTKYAFDKLTRNLALNPLLTGRVATRQIMLAARECAQLPTGIYSSWPLVPSDGLHAEHRGRLMSTQGATVCTLDQFVRHSDLDRVDFIKLDVDGNEHDVLFGGQETLRRFRPTLLMELAPYVYGSSPDKFDSTLELLWSMGFEFTDVANGNALPRDPAKIRRLIPTRGGINVLAISRQATLPRNGKRHRAPD